MINILPDYYFYALGAVIIFIIAFVLGYIPIRKKDIGIHEAFENVMLDVPSVGSNLLIEYVDSIKNTVKLSQFEGEIPFFYPRITVFPYNEYDAIVADEARYFMIYDPKNNKIDKNMLSHLRGKLFDDDKFKELEVMIEKDKTNEILIEIAKIQGIAEGLKPQVSTYYSEPADYGRDRFRPMG